MLTEEVGQKPEAAGTHPLILPCRQAGAFRVSSETVKQKYTPATPSPGGDVKLRVLPAITTEFSTGSFRISGLYFQ